MAFQFTLVTVLMLSGSQELEASAEYRVVPRFVNPPFTSTLITLI